MKTFWKIMLAVAGLVLVPLVLLMALARKITGAQGLQGGADLLFVYSQVNWDEVWQRPQQYAWLSSIKYPAIYCCPVQMHNLLFLGTKWRPVRVFTSEERQLMVLSPLIFSGHFKSRVVHEINSWLTATHVRLALPAGARLRVLANTPFALRVLERLAPAGGENPGVPGKRPRVQRLIFDVIDDFTVFEWSPDFGSEFDKRLTARADAVIAGTHELAAARPAVPFIPCGVDFNLFHTPQPAPSELRNLPRPIIGYFGTISERIDLDLIGRIAREFSNASVVMVGPVHLPENALPRRDNLHYMGLRRHGELPAFAQAFDVGLIPFRLTEATTRLNPVKTLEYLAAGLPVVATALPDLVRFYSDVISIATTHDEFIEQLRNALATPDQDKIARGIARAQGASWQAMADAINSILFAEPLAARAPEIHAIAAPGSRPHAAVGAARS